MKEDLTNGKPGRLNDCEVELETQKTEKKPKDNTGRYKLDIPSFLR